MIVVAAVATCFLAAGAAMATGTWADEVWNMLTFEKATYPTSNFDPYFEKLTKVREGLARGDEPTAKVEWDQFLKMLQARAHGINDVAADELYNFAVAIRPADEHISAIALELGPGSERPMSVPQSTQQTRDDGRTRCVGFADGSCDYWIDDMYDAAGG
jgi:hypothetical protein